MSIDLILGFRTKPVDLAKTLARLDFSLKKASQPDSPEPFAEATFQFFDDRHSTRGVWFTYCERNRKDFHVLWDGVIDDPGAIVATGSITTNMGRSAIDKYKQDDTARYLRDRYNAVLFDPQSGKILVD